MAAQVTATRYGQEPAWPPATCTSSYAILPRLTLWCPLWMAPPLRTTKPLHPFCISTSKTCTPTTSVQNPTKAKLHEPSTKTSTQLVPLGTMMALASVFVTGGSSTEPEQTPSPPTQTKADGHRQTPPAAVATVRINRKRSPISYATATPTWFLSANDTTKS